MAVYRLGPATFSTRSMRTVVSLALAVGVMASFSTYASDGARSAPLASKNHSFSLQPKAEKGTGWKLMDSTTKSILKRSDGLTLEAQFGINASENQKVKASWQEVLQKLRDNQKSMAQQPIKKNGWEGIFVDSTRQPLKNLPASYLYVQRGTSYSLWSCRAENQKLLKDCRASLETLQFTTSTKPPKK